MTTPDIHPRLVVDDAASAIEFYVKALGGVELMRFADQSGKIVHAEVVGSAEGRGSLVPGRQGCRDRG